MSIKLIAVDIDGTLVNSQKEITPEVFSAIQDAKEAGVKVVIATGRPIAGVAKLLDDLQLRDEGGLCGNLQRCPCPRNCYRT